MSKDEPSDPRGAGCPQVSYQYPGVVQFRLAVQRHLRIPGTSLRESSAGSSQFGGPAGKGDALWTGLRHCNSELITFLDGDVSELHPRFLALLNEPLRRRSELHLLKGRFCRGYGQHISGRVTMLTARLLLALLYPDLAHVREPLGGLFAGRVRRHFRTRHP